MDERKLFRLMDVVAGVITVALAAYLLSSLTEPLLRGLSFCLGVIGVLMISPKRSAT